MADAPEAAAVMDWGGTWIRAALVNRQGDILWQHRAPNPQGGGRDTLLQTGEWLLHQALSWWGDRPLAGVGVAIAGPVDDETGTIYDPPNLPNLGGVSLKEAWGARLGRPVVVGNDANLAALGEFYYGVGRELAQRGVQTRTLVYVTVSTGIGGGVVDRGKMFTGSSGLAPEIGHMVIDRSPHAPRCPCGNTGCLEALASGTAIASIARSRASTDERAGSRLARLDPQSLDSEAVFEAAAQGDALAQSILEDVVEALSVGLTNVLHLFNPDLVVLGGGVTTGLYDQGMLLRIHSQMLRYSMSERHKAFQLETARLGDAAGLAGAAGLVWKEHGLLPG